MPRSKPIRPPSPIEGDGRDAATVEQLATLQSQLAEKETLVSALTEQLELAVEQLDRLKRSGADRQRGGVGGFPAELVNNQKQLVDDLQRVVQQWEDMQAGMVLGRLEMQLTELRDFVGERLKHPTYVPSEPEDNSSEPVHEERISLPPVVEERSAPATASWEQLKNQMLGVPEVEAETPDTATVDLPDPPPAVDLDTIAPDDMITAIIERDDYIATLLRHMRVNDRPNLPTDWDACQHSAPELTARLQEQVQHLEAINRRSEVELSLERAKLAREATRIQQQQALIDKQLKRLGLKSLDDLPAQVPGVAPPDRRWVRFLGNK